MNFCSRSCYQNLICVVWKSEKSGGWIFQQKLHINFCQNEKEWNLAYAGKIEGIKGTKKWLLNVKNRWKWVFFWNRVLCWCESSSWSLKLRFPDYCVFSNSASSGTNLNLNDKIQRPQNWELHHFSVKAAWNNE